MTKEGEREKRKGEDNKSKWDEKQITKKTQYDTAVFFDRQRTEMPMGTTAVV